MKFAHAAWVGAAGILIAAVAAPLAVARANAPGAAVAFHSTCMTCAARAVAASVRAAPAAMTLDDVVIVAPLRSAQRVVPASRPVPAPPAASDCAPWRTLAGSHGARASVSSFVRACEGTAGSAAPPAVATARAPERAKRATLEFVYGIDEPSTAPR